MRSLAFMIFSHSAHPGTEQWEHVTASRTHCSYFPFLPDRTELSSNRREELGGHGLACHNSESSLTQGQNKTNGD